MIEVNQISGNIVNKIFDGMSQTTDPPTSARPAPTADAPSERARALVVGAFDLHVHIGPDVPPRRIDDVSLAHRCAELGLAGFALKSHYTSTAERAQVVSGVVPGVRVVGAITLNQAVGGMNALAVEIAAREGARIVWMPTVDSPAETAGRADPKPGDKVPQWAKLQHELRGLGLGIEPVHVTDDEGRVLPATRDVLRTIARHGLVLATAHLARDDTFAVVEAAFEEGVEHVVVTHPEFTAQRFTIEEQVALADQRVPDRALPEHALLGQDDVRARVRRRARGRARAQLLLERLRQPGVPRGRGRPRDVGRPPARRGLRRGRGARDDRCGIPPRRRRIGAGMTEHLHEVAHIAHAELLTPKPEESLRFFVEVLGMEEEARDGGSVYLRGWGDYLRYSLKLTESAQAGIGHVALRTWSPEALERRVAAVEATGLGTGWTDGDVGHGRSYRFTDPDGHAFELFYEAERYVAPPHLRLPGATNRSATWAAARPSSGSTTSICSPPTSGRPGRSARTCSGTGCTSASSSTTARRPARG